MVDIRLSWADSSVRMRRHPGVGGRAECGMGRLQGNFPEPELLARYGLPTLYEWRVKPTGILVTYDGLSNVASPLGLPAALGRE
jgi:hypothetical protein